MDTVMDSVAAIEAILFVTEVPVPLSELAEVLEASTVETEALLAELSNRLADRGSGLCVRQIAGGWRLYSRAEAFPFLERFSASAVARRISPAALEVLAIIAYRQPVSRSQINEIRGVDSDSAVRTLERFGLVEEVGRLSLPGNPVLYGTTGLLLEKLGLRSLEDLPPLADHIPPASIMETLEETFKPKSSEGEDG